MENIEYFNNFVEDNRLQIITNKTIDDYLYIYLKIEVDNNLKFKIYEKFYEKISKNIKLCILEKKYSNKFIENIILSLNEEISYFKTENEIEDFKLSILIFMSDYNSFQVSYLGNINLLLISSEEKKLDLKSNEFYLTGGKYNISILNNVYKLEENDEIFIFDKENEYDCRNNLSFKTYTFIKFLKISKRSLYISDKINKNYIYILLIISILILYFIFNNIYINNNFKKIFLIDDKINELILNEKYILAKEKLQIQLNLLKDLNKKYIYLTKSNIEKKEEILSKKLILKKELDIIENIFIKEDKLLVEVKNNNFDKVIIEYEKIKNLIENFENKYIKLIKYIDKKIIEIENIVFLKNELENNKDNIYLRYKIMKELIEKYKKSSFKIELSKIELEFKDLEMKINELKEEINSKIIKADIKRTENILESKSDYLKIIEELKRLGLEKSEKIEEINIKLNYIKEEIEYHKYEIKRNLEEVKKLEEVNDYNSALQCLNIAKESAEKINEFERLKEINSIIRIITKKINLKIKNEKKENDFYKNKITIEIEMKKTMKLNLEKGDEYLKKLEYKNAIKEYKSALDIINELKLENELKEKTLKKIKYIEEKTNKKWWEIWR